MFTYFTTWRLNQGSNDDWCTYFSYPSRYHRHLLSHLPYKSLTFESCPFNPIMFSVRWKTEGKLLIGDLIFAIKRSQFWQMEYYCARQTLTGTYKKQALMLFFFFFFFLVISSRSFRRLIHIVQNCIKSLHLRDYHLPKVLIFCRGNINWCGFGFDLSISLIAWGPWDATVNRSLNWFKEYKVYGKQTKLLCRITASGVLGAGTFGAGLMEGRLRQSYNILRKMVV